MITLDDFCILTRIGLCEFMGKMAVECEGFDGVARATVIRQLQAAEDDIANYAEALGYVLHDEVVNLRTEFPYFSVTGYNLIQLETVEVTGNITYAQPDPNIRCRTTATVTATLAPQVCQTLYDVAGVWPMLHLGVLWYTSALVANTLTLTAAAENFIEDDGSYAATVKLRVRLQKPSLATAVYPADVCAPVPDLSGNCPPTLVDGYTTVPAQMVVNNSIASVVNYTPPACAQMPSWFALTVLRPGTWRGSWANAVISIANTRLPENYCACWPLASTRFQDDNGTSDRFAGRAAPMFQTPFGTAPGAQNAYMAIRTSISQSKAVSMR